LKIDGGVGDGGFAEADILEEINPGRKPSLLA